jgi:hypothetical protein
LFRERVVERRERGRELLVGERPAISALPDALPADLGERDRSKEV